MNLFKHDWISLLRNKKLLGSVIVMMFIPIIYSGTLLGSFWDPFGRTEQLAVALVNNDQPAEVNGEQMSIGDDLVDELKQNKDFDWHFINEAEAEKGFADNEYYMIVTIPKEFSANAATAMDENPEKMVLSYKINPGRTFIIENISKSATNSLNETISKKITETYIKVMFDNIADLGEGFAEAADGTGKLGDGVTKVLDGNQELSINLEKLASSTLTFKDGAKQLEVGLAQFFTGVGKLNDGATALEQGIAQYTDGAAQLDAGASSLTTGTAQYTDGVKQVNDGATQLADGAAALNEKSTDLTQGIARLVDGSENLTTNLLKAKQEGSTPLSAGLNTLQTESAKLINKELGVPALAAGQANLNDGLNELTLGGESLTTGLVTMKNNIPEAETVQQLTTGMEGIQQLSAGIQQALANGDTATATALSSQLTELTKTVVPGSVQAINGYTELSKGLSNQLIPGAEKLNDGLAEAVEGSESLLAGTNQLNTNIPKLVQGIDDATTGAKSLDTALGKLADGSTTLTQGLAAFEEGTTTYTNGVASIHSGVNSLASGTQELTNKSTDLLSGVNQLASGANALAGNAQPLLDGSNQLASGLSQLAENVPALTEGSGKLASGANQMNEGSVKLAEGSVALGDGLSQVKEGTDELGEKLADGAHQVEDVKADDSNHEMMAAPTELKLEKTSDVPNYAHALAPNFLSLALYIGALAFNLVVPLGIAAIPPKSGREWWFSKASIATVQAIMGALIMDAIMIKGLGLQIEHIGLFVFTSIIVALAYMSIITMLNVTMGNPGRFVVMVLLVIQLASSGAVFPRELTTPFFTAINPYLPMTYAVYGFREAMSSAEGMHLYWISIGILAACVIVVNLILLLVFKIKLAKGKDIVTEQGEVVA